MVKEKLKDLFINSDCITKNIRCQILNRFQLVYGIRFEQIRGLFPSKLFWIITE